MARLPTTPGRKFLARDDLRLALGPPATIRIPCQQGIFFPAVGAPFLKALQYHGVAGYTTHRLRGGAGAEQGISNDQNRELSGDFAADQGKNRWRKRGRKTGCGQVAGRGRDSLLRRGKRRAAPETRRHWTARVPRALGWAAGRRPSVGRRPSEPGTPPVRGAPPVRAQRSCSRRRKTRAPIPIRASGKS